MYTNLLLKLLFSINLLLIGTHVCHAGVNVDLLVNFYGQLS